MGASFSKTSGICGSCSDVVVEMGRSRRVQGWIARLMDRKTRKKLRKANLKPQEDTVAIGGCSWTLTEPVMSAPRKEKANLLAPLNQKKVRRRMKKLARVSMPSAEQKSDLAPNKVSNVQIILVYLTIYLGRPRSNIK
jgi:hypothetical protein